MAKKSQYNTNSTAANNISLQGENAQISQPLNYNDVNLPFISSPAGAAFLGDDIDKELSDRFSIDDSLSIQEVSFKTIDKTFGREDDYVELHILNSNGSIIYSEEDFKDYIIPAGQACFPLTKYINVNPDKILTDRGFFSGKYTLKIYTLKNKIFNTAEFPFQIKEISNNRREIRAISAISTNEILDPAVGEFIADIESSVYFKEFSINLGGGILLPCINILLNKEPFKHEVLLKTLSPLNSGVVDQIPFKIVEEISDPLTIEIDLGEPQLEDDTILLRGPNYHIDTRTQNSIPTSFKSYDDLLHYNVTSSYEHLLNKLEDGGADINIDYTYIRPVSESSEERNYHFENFSHFSSATERLKNFHYKIKLIEKYDSDIAVINDIQGPTSSSFTTLKAKNDIYDKKQKLIKGFDGYENYLYFDSGNYSWPKQNSLSPYVLFHTTSSQVKSWYGDERSTQPGYGGQLESASLYDKQNEYSLSKTIPTHILENLDNELYISFVNMIGQHFDNIWTYIKAISDIHNSSNNRGISKDLVYYQLKSLGIEAFDQFENANLIEYMLGEGTGSGQYDATNFYSSSGVPSETMITASNQGSIPKGDISKEIWKRLFHNAPYLLKTKGTERGIKALMSCYGVPTSILSIKEYGGSSPISGPLKDLDTADTYKTFTYEKASLALQGYTGTNGYFVKTNWSSSLTDALSASAKTIEFRIKPTRLDNDSNQHLFTLSGSNAAKDPTLVLNTHTGNDISTYGDSNQYGKLDLYINNAITASTDSFPIYNGDFWNIFIGIDGVSGSASDITFGAYQANWLKNVSYYTASLLWPEADRALTFGDPYHNFGARVGGAQTTYICGLEPNVNSAYNTVDVLPYSGSLQEIKYHFGEFLSHETLKKHALEPSMYAGNTISSSYDHVVLRLPLGSNDKQDSSSFHPNIDVDYLGMVDGVSSSLSIQKWEEIVENHYLPTPDTVGASMTSDKVRIDEGTPSGDILSPFISTETSTLDRQPQDFEDLGIFFSPQHELNEDIIYTLGSFRLDDYIGSPLPSSQTSSEYSNLSDIRDIYFKKVKRKRYNIGAFIKQIQYIDHTLFKMIEQWVPFKSNLKTGVVIEPHILERNKIARELPIRDDGQTMITGSHQTLNIQIGTEYQENHLYKMCSGSEAFGTDKKINNQWEPGSYVNYHSNRSSVTSSKEGDKTRSRGSQRLEQGTNTTIDIWDDYLDPSQRDPNTENHQASQAPIKPFTTEKPHRYIAHQSSVLLGNAMKGRKSNKYYKYKQYYLQSSSLY
tara:strand:- start:5115 stop:8936 length:3822 start_codon:yes stop_codon:yes gene_type:complete